MIAFHKYQGTGNDFILIDNRDGSHDFQSKPALVKKLCDRHFGIGADGLILLEKGIAEEYRMEYFNSNGYQGSFCGNGSRCFVLFMHKLGLAKGRVQFEAFDGPHEGQVMEDGRVSVKMKDLDRSGLEKYGEDYVVNTGSPHLIRFIGDLKTVDPLQEGRAIRNSDTFRKEGINVNFVHRSDGKVFLRTYERGVEDLTLSCGTGVTAVALTLAYVENRKEGSYDIVTDGGMLNVSFNSDDKFVREIWLTGPAQWVFSGEYPL